MRPMEEKKLIKEIEKLKKEKKAIILAHNYQRPEVQDIADFVGDSLELSTKAKDTDAKTIIFCGVHFMAETAKILSPEKKVILPRIDAGCPMADMVTVEALKELKDKYQNYLVVTYVNSPASVKAISDSCCTSSNAINVVRNIESNNIIFVPDRNLAHYVSRFVNKNILPWQGFCPTHERLEVKDILEKKTLFPNAKVLVHPECKPEVVNVADKALSTSGIINFCSKDPTDSFIIGTEMGILHRLKKENPQKTFVLASERLVCPNMKLTRIEDVYTALLEEKDEIDIPLETIEGARKALLNMYRLNY
jgi:quinolinate synthase